MFLLMIVAVLCTAQSATGRGRFSNRASANGVTGRNAGRFARRAPAPSAADVLAGRAPPASPASAAQRPRRDATCLACQKRCAFYTSISGGSRFHDDCSADCVTEWFCPRGSRGCDWRSFQSRCPQQPIPNAQ